ncbi:MAG: DUF58 domain-containing protein, partial [Planctomycetes bacterium]|nr:DUF58 domain-containing protein [Planctomycetota bacterium]
GDTVTISIKIANRSKLPIAWVLVEDLLPPKALMTDPPSLDVQGERIQLMRVRGHQQKTIRYRMVCNRRGYFQIGPLVLETGDLFGLHRRYRVMNEPNFLLVYPQIVPLEGYEIASRRPIGEVTMSYRLFEDPTRIAGVRRYEAGDPLNRIHWRATARTAKLHSKVYEPSTVSGATILLDFHKYGYDARNEPYRSELAITTAASISHALYQVGQQVGLFTNGRDAADRIRTEGWDQDPRTRESAHQAASMHGESDRLRPIVLETQRGPEQFMNILETLARLELTDGLDVAGLVMETMSRMARDASVIAILSAVSPSSAVALGTLRRQGFSVTAMLSCYDEMDYARMSGPLLAEGIETRHLKDESVIATICRKFVLR